MNISFSTRIKLLTGFTVAFVDTRKGNRLFLPTLGGQPYIPASTMRGRLRHTAARMIIDGRERHGLPKLTLADLNWLVNGGVKQGKDDEAPPVADMMQYRPLCAGHLWSFWGFSEPMFMESRAQIEHAQPTDFVRPVEIPGQRTDWVQRGEFGPEHVADPDSFDAWFGRITQRKAQKAAEDQDKKQRRSGKTEAVPAANGEPEDRKKEATIVPANMPFSREIIPPGTELTTYIEINNATDLQTGMFVATMREFSQRPVFGAQAGTNLGLVDLHMEGGGETITIDGRNRSFEVSASLRELEKQFRDAFPDTDFSTPVLKK